jgi:F-type H+-transporting ATPase subunit b
MLIDWFTVGAQALNFLILVWLMKRFLYKPILNAIEEREKLVAAELADAARKKAEAQTEGDEFKRKNEDFDRQRSALLTKAVEEANAERQKLLDAAGKAAEELSQKRQENMRNEEQNLRQALNHKAEGEVFAIARKTLSDLAGTSLEERLSVVFIRRLREMDVQAKGIFEGALKKAGGPAVLRSAFDLPGEQRAAVQKALNETFSCSIPLKFETAPDLVSGLEVVLNGQKIAWNIADYLKTLEKGVEELLREKEKVRGSSVLTTKIAKRAYEIYEQKGHRSDSAEQDWKQAESEIRKNEPGSESGPKEKQMPKPKVELKLGSNPEVKPDLKPEFEPGDKPEVKPGPKLEEKPEPKVEDKPEPQPEAVVGTGTAEPQPIKKAS